MKSSVKSKRFLITFVTMLVLMLTVLILPSLSASAEEAAVEVESITLSKTSSWLYTTQTETLTATVSPSNATNKNIVWTSSNPSVATVNQSGVVTGISLGSATITATAADGSGVYATCEYTVNPYQVYMYYPSKNQDARRVQFEFTTDRYITRVEIYVGDREYTVNRPSFGSAYDYEANGERIKVTVQYNPITENVLWKVQLKLAEATTHRTTEDIYLKVSNGQYNAITLIEKGFVFWDSELEIGGTQATTLISIEWNDMIDAINYFDYEVVDSVNFETMMFNPQNSLGTGSLVLKRDKTSHYIYDILYVIRFGDVAGNGSVGDGITTEEDLEIIESYLEGTYTFGSFVMHFGADADLNGSVDIYDAMLIEEYLNGTISSINQNFPLSYVPPQMYYVTTAVFS